MLTVDQHARGMLSTSAILLVRRVIVTVGAAVATGVITRQLSTGGFGTYSAALATFYLALAFCDLGFGAVLARESSSRPGERPGLLRAALRPAVVWSLVVAAGIGVFAAFTAEGLRLELLLVLVPAVALSGGSIARQWFVVRYDARRMGIVDLTTNLVQVAFLIVVALLGGGPLLLAAVVMLSTLANIVIVATMALRESGPAVVKPGVVRQLVKMSLPIGIPSVLTSAYASIDLVIAGFLVPAPEVGRYAAAVKLLTLVTVLPSILMSVALVGFSAVNAIGDKRATGEFAARSWRWMMAFGLPTCVALIFFADLACRVFFGPQYASSAQPLRVLMAAGVLALLGSVLGTLLIASGKTTATMIQTSVVLCLNITLNVLLLPRYGIMAAAWTTLGTEAVSICCGLIILRSVVSWGPSVAVSRVPLLACAVLAGVSFLPIPNDYLRAAAAGIAFMLVMSALRGWPVDPLAMLRGRGRTAGRAGAP